MTKLVSLTLEAVDDTVFKLENVFVLVLLFNFEGHIAGHVLVKCFVDTTYEIWLSVLIYLLKVP